MRIVSWNVNGLRAIMKKGFREAMSEMKPDVLCLQETKAQKQEVQTITDLFPEYHAYINSAKNRKGYSGTTILVREKPASHQYDINQEHHDQEGRVVTLEFETFQLVNVYVPNSGRELVRLDYREEWDRDFASYLDTLQQVKPVIVCGDFNVAHQPIDLARPQANYNKTAGYTQREIDGFSHLLNRGFIDTFRMKYPERQAFSYWSYMFNARKNNVGWRIDYVLVSEPLQSRITEAFIWPDYEGSDHCPVGIELQL